MTKDSIICSGKNITYYKVRNVVIGSGCAAFNAADWLYDLGEKDTVMITDGINRGTSRNAGSDKQTYYKLSLAGEAGDSVEEMAKTLFSGRGVNGDTALCEAACSVKCFMKLANLGVGFPTNRFGEYVGYKTDHDPRSRATSAGPLTSKDMTEALERSVRSKNITILDGLLAVKLATENGRVNGVIALSFDEEGEKADYTAFECENVIMATGGPAGIYANVVYPVQHTGMSSLAFEAGAKGANLEEWQYGTASVDFRWNVSGTYQQVLPRYVSVDKDGNEREFLSDYIKEENVLLYQFRKGYQWPFTSSNVPGSSEVDIAVSKEIEAGRDVYMDFMHNQKEFESVEKLPEEARNYLTLSGAVQNTPVERLKFMNPKAYKLYLDHEIDIEKEMLRIAVCAQHCNGGVSVDANWETDVKGLYVCGEAAGTFGVHRPGGSALNSTQVGSLRAAEHIAYKKTKAYDGRESVIKTLEDLISDAEKAFGEDKNKIRDTNRLIKKMSTYAAHVRDIEKLKEIKAEAESLLENYYEGCGLKRASQLRIAFRKHDVLVTISGVASAMIFAGERYGSRGGSMTVPDKPDGNFKDENAVIITEFKGKAESMAVPVRPIPDRDGWFETAWTDYINRTKK